jgi:hypothetical protein
MTCSIVMGMQKGMRHENAARMQYGHATWTCSTDMQHGHAARTFSTGTRHGHLSLITPPPPFSVIAIS